CRLLPRPSGIRPMREWTDRRCQGAPAPGQYRASRDGGYRPGPRASGPEAARSGRRPLHRGAGQRSPADRDEGLPGTDRAGPGARGVRLSIMNAPVVITEQIRDLTIPDIAALSAPELACLIDDLAIQKAALRRVEETLDAALDRRYGPRAHQCRAEAGKDAGTVRFEDHGFVIIADLPKRVKWDQDKLRHAAEI